MKKKIVIKIISGVIIFSFAVFFLQAFIPTQASAATTGLHWSNPNQNGNPYKFKPQDVLNSQLIMQVVGCTGVVDKISGAILSLFQKKLKAKIDQKKLDALKTICQSGKGATEMGTAIADEIGTQFTNAIKDVVSCDNIQKTSDPASLNQQLEKAQQDDSARKTTECYNGIAMTLAKNQLTAMTKYTMNWINSGFNGNPMYVQNITALTNSTEKSVLQNGITSLTSSTKAFPYGADFARSMVTSYQAGTSLKSGATNFLDSLTSDLGAFITDPTSYLPDTTLTPLQRAQKANDTFAGDFSSGGWNAWLALTQKDANNPLGFAMQVSQYEADQQAAQIQGTKDEVAQNNGFLSQKKCVKYSNPDGSDPDVVGVMKPIAATTVTTTSPTTASLGLQGPAGTQANTSNSPISSMGIITPTSATTTSIGLQGAAATATGTPVCLQWDTVTPGSIIKDQLSTFVNSPERQLELADTINKALNSVFSALISQFQSQGLPSLSSDQANTSVSDSLGAGANTPTTDDLGNPVSLSSGYTDGSFDLTRDLGNIFIHNYAEKSQGDWDADKNIPELNIGVAPLDDQGNPLANVYYTVSVAGNTKLINEVYNGWAVGDRAFWDGSTWQNWKKGTADPIANRGVIQIQKDYIVAAKEMLANLPAIMPKIGELDYCIPGPNPNWQANTADTYSAFSDYSYSLTSQYKAGSLLSRDTQTYQIAQPGQDQYDNYKKLFEGTTTFSGTLDTGNARETTAALPSAGIFARPASTGQIYSSAQVTTTEPWIDLNNLGSEGTLRNSLAQDKIEGYVNDLLTKIGKDLQNFNTQYDTIINNTYGPSSLMQKQFIEREDTSEEIPNPAWLPMASDGLNITKDIVNYASDLDTTAQGYKDDIVQANANIAKLNTIKDQVSVIIKAAQKRRDDNLLKILADEA